MKQGRSFLTFGAFIILSGTAAISAEAQKEPWRAKPSPLADSLAVLPDGMSLYSEKPIWVDTVAKYDVEVNEAFMWDSTKALLNGIRLSQSQMTSLDVIFNQYIEAAWVFFEKKPTSLSLEAGQHRSGKFFHLLQGRQVVEIRAILTPEQRIMFDERVKARNESKAGR